MCQIFIREIRVIRCYFFMSQLINTAPGPHHGQPILVAGESLATAKSAMIMVHGRGSNAEDILSLSQYLTGAGMAYLAPQAAQNTWYPQRFLAPLAANEPYLSSALATIEAIVAQLQAANIPPERTILLGFSQGACLSAEFAARHAQRYGGVAVLSGALIGPPEIPRNYTGSFADTPIFLGCSDVDFHIPKERVQDSTIILRQLGAAVTERLYPGLGHTVNQDELEMVQAMIDALLFKVTN